MTLSGSLGPNPGRIQIDSAALMLHSYQMDMLAWTFQMLQSVCYSSMSKEKNYICIETF